MIDHRFHELLAVRRICLERPADRPEVQERPPRAEVRVCVGECRAVLPEVTVEGRSETLERHAERSLEAFEDRDRQGHLGGLRVALVDPEIRLVALQHAPHAWQKHFELFVVEAVVSVQVFQLGEVYVIDTHRIAVKAQHRLLTLR